MRFFLLFHFKTKNYSILYNTMQNSRNNTRNTYNITQQLFQKFKALTVQEVYEIQDGTYFTRPVGSKTQKSLITCRAENHSVFSILDLVFVQSSDQISEIKLGDLFLISQSNKWCLSSRQFFRLFALVWYGKCDVAFEKLFQGSYLMTNSYRKFELGCQQNNTRRTRELDEKMKLQAGVFRYSEYSPEFHVHTISFLVKLLIFGEVPTRFNIPNNLGTDIPLRMWDVDRVFVDAFLEKYYPNMNRTSIDAATSTPPGFDFPLDVEPKTKVLPPKVIFSKRELMATKIPGYDETLYDIKVNTPELFHELQNLVVREQKGTCWGDMSDDEEFFEPEKVQQVRSYSSVASSSS